MDVMSSIQENISAEEDDGEKTIKDGYVSEPYVFNYSFKESIIYSLAVGVSTRDKDGLRFLYEDHEHFAPLPTFGVIPALSGTGGLVTGGVPGLTIDLSKVLHGEQFIKILKPLPAEAKLTNTYLTRGKEWFCWLWLRVEMRLGMLCFSISFQYSLLVGEDLVEPAPQNILLMSARSPQEWQMLVLSTKPPLTRLLSTE